MKTVEQLLEGKGREVWSIKPEASVYEALQMMADKEVGALLVLDDEESVVGILSERDYARKVILFDRESRSTTVADIMTDKVVGVSPANTVQECMALMTDKRIRHLPVLDGDRLMGLISIGDVVRSLISEQQFIIEQLERYITS